MKFPLILLTAVALAGLALVGPLSAEDEKDNDAPPEGVEVQARGQVHEAFAEGGSAVATPGVVVSKTPPERVEEQPPEEKPEGDNIVWIPGYWGWDEEAGDFVWVSGAWRAVPPGRTWVPGSWQKVMTGHQWVSGYWGEAAEDQTQPISTETDYLPEPPESVEAGPSTPAPSEEHTYVPGVHVYQVNRYVWRPGYWVRYRPGWVWTPACYKWTPCGYVYVSGFWDVPLCDRGLLFAPVTFTRAAYLRRGFVYRPAYVIQPDFLIGALFVRNRTRTYYFGNYFEQRYRRDYVSWVNYRVAKQTYDPNYTYYRRTYAKYPTWDRNLRTLYTARYANDIARPPVTLVQQRKVIDTIVTKKTASATVHKTVTLTNAQNVTVLTPIRKSSSLRVTGLATLAGIKPADYRTAPVTRTYKVERLSKERAQAERRHAERMHVIARERKAAEVKTFATLPRNGKVEKPVRVRVELPKTTPPARVIKAPVTPPPPPVKIKQEVKITPPPVKDRTEVPPAKDRFKVDPPPAKDRSKVDPPPAKDKGKVNPPPAKDKWKVDPPPVKDRLKVDPPPAKDRFKVDPPPGKDKGKFVPPPAKDGNKPPPPAKDRIQIRQDNAKPPVRIVANPPKETFRSVPKETFKAPPQRIVAPPKVVTPPPVPRRQAQPFPPAGTKPPVPFRGNTPPPGRRIDREAI